MKKSVVKFIKTCVRGGVLALSSLLVFSCGEDSGLGASVDTEAPKIEITYPPLAACIRDTFKLAGTCDDDKNVSKILITVTDTNTKEPVDTVIATIDSDGKKWQADINPFDSESQKYKYSDGNYQFTAEAHDGAGHKTSASRSFDLDNSAPVFVISNPGVIKSQGKKASAYGSRFTIDGTIADDHTIASLTAKIVDENGTLVGEYKEEDIATAGGTSVVIAEHYFNRGDQAAKTTQNNRYDEIYGTDDAAGTKKFYCTVLVEDSTKQYKDPSETENTTSGNVSSKLWLNDSVYKSLISSKLGLGLSVADFMTILNGSYPDSTKASQALEILNSSVIDTGNENGDDKDASKLSFSLNPQANPTYNVNGFAPSEDSEGNAVYIEASSGNTVSVTISAGLDGTAILPGKVKVWTVLVDGLDDTQKFAKIQKVADLANKAQKPYASVAEINEHAQEIKAAVESQFAEKEVILVCDNSGDDGSSVTMTNISGMLPKDAYTSGRIYAFVVTGCDEDDVEFSHNSLYAFKASEAGVAPTLTIAAHDEYVKSTEKAIINGTAIMPEGSTLKVDSIKVELTVQNADDGNTVLGSYIVRWSLDDEKAHLFEGVNAEGEELYSDDPNDSLSYDKENGEWTFTPEKIPGFAYKAEENSGKLYTLASNVTATSTTKQYITKSDSIYVDAKKPAVEIKTIKPTVDGTQFFEGDAGESGENAKTYVNGLIEIQYSVDEANLNNVYYTLSLDGNDVTSDYAGSSTEKIDLGKRTNGSIFIDTTKLFDRETESKKLVVTVTAEDVCENKGSYTSTDYNTVEGVPVNKPIEIRQETDIPRITLGNASYSNEYAVTGDSATDKAHKAAIRSDTSNLFNTTNDNTLEINLTDDDQVASVTVYVYPENGGSTPLATETKTFTKTSAQWKYPLPNEEAVYQLKIEVRDSKLSVTPAASGQTALPYKSYDTGLFFIAIDDGAPEVTINSPSANSYQEEKFIAKGVIAQNDEGTKIHRYIRKLDQAATSAADGKEIFAVRDSGTEITINSDKTWTDSLEISEEDIYRIEYESTDRYNQNSMSAVRIIIDKTNPEIKDADSSVGGVKGAAGVSSDDQWFNNVTLQFKGAITEKVGVDMIYYWLDKEPVKVGGDGPDKDKWRLENESDSVLNGATKSFAATQNTQNTSLWEYTENISGFSECDAAHAHKLTLVAVDKAGNQSNPIVYSKIKVDMTQPYFGNYYYKLIKNGTVAVEGEVSGRILTNGGNDVELYGLISDAGSGVDTDKLLLNVINSTASGTQTDILAGSFKFTTSPIDAASLASGIESAEWKSASEIADKTKITAWKAEITASDFKAGEVRANYYDNAGNYNENFKMFTIAIDNEAPKLGNHSFTDEKAGFEAYKDSDFDLNGEKIPHYYVNNGAGHSFALSGITTDNEGIAKIELVGTTKTAAEASFSWTGITLPDLDSDSNITIKITDIANNVLEQKIHITPDIIAPNGIHLSDSSNGTDKIFRVGDSDNLLEEITVVRPDVTNVEGQDKDVGSNYAPGTYGNSNSIKIRGQFKENGSGLKSIYYKIFQNTPPSPADITAFISNYENEKSGVFAPLSANETRLVKVNSSDTVYEYQPIESNYKMSIAGFAEGKNYLVLAAVDYVGNVALDTVTYKYTPAGETTEVSLDGCFSINVDTSTPELEENVNVEIDGSSDGLSASQILTNFEKGNITLSGKASDADSGIKSVVLYVEGKGSKTAGGSVAIDKNTTGSSIAATLTAGDSGDSEGTKKWSGEIAASLFSEVSSGTFAVYATVKDNAGDGNMVNRSVATIIVDKTKPTVELKNPADADSATSSVIEINGIIDLSGEISDGNILPDTAITAIQYTTNASASADSDTGWQTLSADSHAGMDDFALSGNYTFSARNFDTSKLTEDTEYYLRAKATDKAGNVGYSAPVTVKVDQDTDRPLIKFSTMDEADAIISSQTIKGTLSDDDGSVTSFKYKDGEAADWTEITVQSGEWTINDLAGGAHSLKFQITDAKGTVFETEKTEGKFADDGKPYVLYAKADSVKSLNSAAAEFKIDLNAPSVQSMGIASTETTAAPVEPETVDETHPSPYASGRTKSFGTNARYMWLKVIAKEDVALNDDFAKDVSLKVGKNTITLTDKITRTGTIGTDDTDPGFTYIIGPIDTSSITEEGTLTVAIVVTDKSGRASDALTGTIFIDKKAPEVTVTSPNLTDDGASTDSIVGTTVLRGQASDSSVITKFFYMIPTNAQIGATGIFKDLSSDGTTGYTYSDAHGWIDINTVENSKGALNDYTEHTALMWEIPVTSSKFVTESTDGLSLIEYATAKAGTGLKYAETTTIESSVSTSESPKYCVYVPLYFYTEDETGMSKVTPTKILVDPYAGIPQLEIATPEDFAKTGGNLNFQGSVTDDAGDADKVVLTKLEFSCTDATESSIDTVTDWVTVTREILAEAEVVTKGTLSATDATITAEGKPSSWKISINTSAISTDKAGKLAALLGKQGSGDDEEAKDIKITRATFVAYDKNGTASTFQVETLADDNSKALVKNVFVDKNAPKMSNIQLVQYDDVPDADTVATAVPTLSRSYTAGMYISHNNGNGDWYLKATITDDASVEGFTISSGKAYIPLAGKAEKGKAASGGIIVSGLGEKECTFIIPIDTETLKNGNGKTATQFYPTIELDDGQHTDVTQNLSFFVDNTAPGMYLSDDTTETPNDEIAVDDKSKLRLKDFNGLVVGSENVVENSDGSYTFGDTIKESGSGLAYVAVWFRKEKSGVGYWYNAIERKKAGGGTSINNDGNGVTIDGSAVKINAENLPVKVFENCKRPALNQIGHSSLAGYTDFGVGSLVKIGGSYHLITDKGENGTSGTITIDDDVDTSFTTVEMVYANVVNHQVAEGFESGWTVSNDDGDGFVEMVKQSGNNYKWQATLRSDFIPDGPVQIHVVAFDEAGNVNSGYVETSIQNNRPRISKVFLGTDLNGNGKFDYFSESSTGAVAANNELYPGYAANGTEYGELSFYSALSSDGKIQGTVTLKSSNFVAKDKLLVLPEIIGGNTTATQDLKYLYKVVDNVEDASITKLSIASGSLKSLYTDSDSLSLADKAGTAQTVAELLAENHKADKWNYYDTTQTDYKGEDDTHGGVVTGKYKGLVLENDTLVNYESWTSGQAVGSVKYFAFTIWDATSGTTQGKDSLYALLKIPMVVNVVDDIAPKAVIHPFYWNSKEDGSFCYDENGVALGHIDIDDGTGTTNPGVSGQVWINATVEDETRLSSATFTDPGDTKKVVANYSNGNWEVVETGLPAHWKKVEILDSPEPNQAGHKMSFRVAIDMTQYGLGNNRTVNAGAVDKSNTESDTEDEQTIDPKAIAGTTHTGKLTSHYIMNFVPYIKSIYPATESSASRSRLGKFPVQAGKPMIIEGMNFAAGAEYCVSFYKSKLDVNGSMVQDDSESATTDVYTGITSDTDGQIKINAPNYSRWVKVWINTADGWIGTMNNENVDYGCNIEEGYVPSDDNGKGNQDRGLKRANDAGTNFWTDDRYIAVWNVDTRFPGSSTPISGVVKKLDEKNTGSKVPANDVAGGGYIYKQKGYSGTIESLPNQNDHYYGVMSSYDLKVYGYVSEKGNSYYETLGTGDNVNSNDSETTFVAPADELDYTVVNGLPYYVMQDNALCGESANRWGSGLFLSRDGYQHDRKYSSAYQSDLQEEEEFYIIERLGASGTTAASRDSSSGYDNVLHQFKNPRITGWNNPNEQIKYTDADGGKYSQSTDYIYVSYYDSYAKCLKYAAYKVGHRFDGDKIATVAGQHWGSHNQRSDCIPLMHTAKNKLEKNNNVAASDNQKTGNAVVAGWDTLITGQSTFKEKAGEWSDIMLDTSGSSPIPVIIYYNETNKCLEVAVGKTSVPSSGNIANYTNPETKTGITYSADKTKNAWTKTTGIRPNNKVDFGRYVSAVMDKNYNIHAAAQDVTNGKLYYIFLSKADGYKADKAIYKVVDASGTSGMWTDIELTNDNESNTKWYQYQPVISHMDKGKLNTTKAVKAAYVVTETTNGVTNAYWESMTDPAIYSANDQRTSVMCDVYEQGETSYKAPVAVGFNSDMLALDFLRGEE